MQFTFLGTGTSQGIPIIGCTCAVCLSSNPQDKRLRTAAMVSWEGKNWVIDAGPDFRQQMLREGVDNIEAILFTHEHNDHTAGLDDVRPINFKHNKHIPLYATPSVQKDLKTRFAYAFDSEPYPGAPLLDLKTITKDHIFEVSGLCIQPIEVSHGLGNTVLGFRFKDLVYITDCKSIDDIELEKVKGAKILIINALHRQPHYSHLNLEEALHLMSIIKPEQGYLTHLSHNMGKAEDVNQELPPHIALAYDGLKIEF